MLSSFGSQMFKKIYNHSSPLRLFSREIAFIEYKPVKITAYNNCPGVLRTVCDKFLESNINLVSIESKVRNKRSEGVEAIDFYVTYEEPNDVNEFQDLVFALNKLEIIISPLPLPRCHRFPIQLSDLDNMKLETMVTEIIDPNDPYHADKEYIDRRAFLTASNEGYKMGTPINYLEYTDTELKTWQTIWDKLMPKIQAHGSETFVKFLNDFIKLGLFQRNKIPQLEDQNKYLIKKNNWKIKPVNGIISARQYLNILAFRTFPSTQYIRHHSTPDYTPEPDICHEFFGHMAAFADPVICDLSHKIGLLSQGATDSQIKLLGAIYWYTIEFGMVMEKGQRKFYGGGIASSAKEIDNMLNCEHLRKLDLINDMINPDSIIVQDVQPFFYWANNFREVVEQLDEFGRMMGKPFNVHYDFQTNEVVSDKAVEFLEK